MASQLIEIELKVRDVDRSLRFYRELLGVPFAEPEVHDGEGVRHAHATWGEWGSEGFLLFNLYPAPADQETRASIGLAADDLDALHARLVREGVEVVRPPEPRPWGRMAIYRDPDGNTVSVTERPR